MKKLSGNYNMIYSLINDLLIETFQFYYYFIYIKLFKELI